MIKKFGSGVKIDLKSKSVTKSQDSEFSSKDQTINTPLSNEAIPSSFKHNTFNKSGQEMQYQDGKVFREFHVDSIVDNPYQKSQYSIEEVGYLIKSIKERDNLRIMFFKAHPELSDKYYPLFGGHRFIRALKEIGRKTFWSIELTKNFSPEQELDMIIAENNHRNSPNIIVSYKLYSDVRQINPSYTYEDIAKKYNTSKSAVANAMKLKHYPQELLDNILANFTLFGDGKIIILSQLIVSADDPNHNTYLNKLTEFCSDVIANSKKLTDKDFLNYVHSVKKQQGALTDSYLLHPSVAKGLSSDYESKLGANVTLSVNKQGGGQVKLKFTDNVTYERIIKILDAASNNI